MHAIDLVDSREWQDSLMIFGDVGLFLSVLSVGTWSVV